jgi:hypothetical protein
MAYQFWSLGPSWNPFGGPLGCVQPSFGGNSAKDGALGRLTAQMEAGSKVPVGKELVMLSLWPSIVGRGLQ